MHTPKVNGATEWWRDNDSTTYTDAHPDTHTHADKILQTGL